MADNLLDILKSRPPLEKLFMGAVVIGIISVFLPWFSVSVTMLGMTESNTVVGIEGVEGFLAFVFLATVLFIYLVKFLKESDEARKKQFVRYMVIACGLAVLSQLVFFLRDPEMPSRSVKGEHSLGWFLAFFSGLASTGLCYICFMNKAMGEKLLSKAADAASAAGEKLAAAANQGDTSEAVKQSEASEGKSAETSEDKPA